MKHYLLVALLIALAIIALVGLVRGEEIDIHNVTDIHPHPYQIVGYYELGESNYVTRIILNRAWIKKVNKDKYYLEFIMKKPWAEKPK